LGVSDPILTILFAGLWCLADRSGRLEDRPARIKAEIFPYRELPAFDNYLCELQKLGFISRYDVNEVSIIQVVNFVKHQNPHANEKQSELPEKPFKSRRSNTTVKTLVKHQSCTRVAPELHQSRTDKIGTSTMLLGLIPDSLIPDSLIPDSPNARPLSAASLQVNEIFHYWKTVMDKTTGAKLTKERDKAVRSMLKTGYCTEDIKRAIDGCKRSAWHQGDNDRHAIYDDLELICRTGKNLEKFMNTNDGTDETRLADLLNARLTNRSWANEVSPELSYIDHEGG